MKRKWFDLQLYTEGLRQLRLMGLLFTAAVGLIVIFIPVGEYINTVNMASVSARTISYLEMNPLIVGAFCIVAPFLTLNLFSFVNKRESSDFYHNTPATRTCLFFSFFAAVLTWLLIFVTGTALLSVLCHSLFPSLFVINFESVLQISLNCFAGGVLVAASVAIAMSVTGTMVMNVLLALLIIFVPRILLKLILMAICDAFPLVGGLVFAPLLNTQYNIPAGYVLQYFFGDGSPLTAMSSFLYTVGLSVIYTALAWLLFKHRRSEGAGHSAPTPLLQAFYRFLVGFTISSIITVALCSDYSSYYDASDLFPWVFAYVLTVFAMVVFEILCTRRFRGLIRRSLVTIGLLVVANLALVGGITGAKTILKSYSPAAQDITSVRVVEIEGVEHGYGETDYFSSQASKIDLKDPDVLSVVSEQLRYTLDVLEISENRYYEELYNSRSIIVSIKSGGFSHMRRIIMSEEDIDLLTEALAKNESYQKLYMQLPTNYQRVHGDTLNLSVGADAKRLFDTLQAEVKEMGFQRWYALLNRTVYDDPYDKYSGQDETVISKLFFFIPSAEGWTSYGVPLSAATLPKTTAVYLELHGKINGAGRSVLLNTLIQSPTDCDYVDCSATNVIMGGDRPIYYWHYEQIKENAAPVSEFAAALQKTQNEPIDPAKPFCYLYASGRVNNDKGMTDYVVFEGYYVLTEESIALLESLSAEAEKG